jgi:hypothetical protein
LTATSDSAATWQLPATNFQYPHRKAGLVPFAKIEPILIFKDDKVDLA